MVSEWDSSWSRGGSCALFIHFEHSWQPAWALMQRERERNRKWWCYISLFSPACFVELSLLPILLFQGLPGQQGVGKGEAGGRWMEREVFALKPHRTGKVFIRVRRCPDCISHSVHSALRGACGEAARQSISTAAWPTGQRGMAPQQCQQQHPLRSASRELCLQIHPVAFQPHLAHPDLPAVLCKQPRVHGLQHGSHSWNSWWPNCLHTRFGATIHSSTELSKSKLQPEDPWNTARDITSPLITGLCPCNALLIWKNHSLLPCHSCRGIPAEGTYQKMPLWYLALDIQHREELLPTRAICRWVKNHSCSLNENCHYLFSLPSLKDCHTLTNHLHVTFHSGAKVTSQDQLWARGKNQDMGIIKWLSGNSTRWGWAELN